jgi:hypothetical protein
MPTASRISACFSGGNQLAVDDAGPRRQREDSRGDRRKPAREIAAFRLKIAAT